MDIEKAYNHVNWDFLLYMVFFLGNHFMIVINGRICKEMWFREEKV